MALPLQWVDEIHARLMIRYGSAWTAKWAGFDETMMRAVKTDWSQQLDNMSPESIRKALDSLPPDFPPTASAFRALGIIRSEAQPALPAPSIDQSGMKRIAGELKKAAVTGRSLAQHAEECFAHLNRLKREGNLSPAQRSFLERATETASTTTVAAIGEFRAPSLDTLPEGMR